MKWCRESWLVSGAAGVGVVAIGLTWVLPNLGRYEKKVSGPDCDGGAAAA